MLWKTPRPSRNREEAFTLIELITAVVIIGLLAAIGVPAFGQVQRQAISATVKSDIRNSVNAVLENSNSMLKFTTPEHFDRHATTTEGNTITLWVDGTSREVACIWGSHTFGDNDVVSYWWSSETGTIGNGSCVGEHDEVVTGGYEGNPGDAGALPDVDEPTASTPPTGGTNQPPATPGNPPAGEVLEPTAPPLDPDEEGEEENDEEGEGDEGTSPDDGDNTSPPPTVTEPTNPTNPGAGDVPVTDNRNKFPVCHKNNGKKSYKLNMLPLSAILNGHAGMHHQGGGDIIPPISHGRFAGQNWDAAGQALFYQYCS